MHTPRGVLELPTSNKQPSLSEELCLLAEEIISVLWPLKAFFQD